MSIILVVVVLLLLFGAMPTWPYSAGWGWGPAGIGGVLLLVLIVLLLTGHLGHL